MARRLRAFAFAGAACVFVLTSWAAPARAEEIWVAPTLQQDLGGLGIASGGIWPATPVGAVRFVLAVPDDLQTFQSAKIALIPQAADGASSLNLIVCAAQNSDALPGACAASLSQTFTGAASHLVEVGVDSLIGPHVGAPGISYLAIIAYTTPATGTDHIVGLRFDYTPKTPAGVATLAANTFTGTQTAPAFVGDGSGLTNVARLGANTFSGAQTAPAFVGDGSGLTNLPAIQNTTSPQAGANFNIAGNGTVGGTLAAGAVKSSTEYDIGSNRVLSVSGSFGNSTFLGVTAGPSTYTSTDNSFFGALTGYRATTGSFNSFFGSNAGAFVTSGTDNAFFGYLSGYQSTGNGNAFFGSRAGQNPQSGAYNSLFGYAADAHHTPQDGSALFGAMTVSEGTNNTLVGFQSAVHGDYSVAVGSNAIVQAGVPLVNATAIGANATVTASNSLVLGSISGINSSFGDTNVGIGTTAPVNRLQVVDRFNTGLRVQTGTAGGTVGSFGGLGAFQIDAPGTAGGRLQVSENGNVGIGTNAPGTKLVVNGGGVFITNPNTLIITSPNGACWGITVNNTGGLGTFPTSCP